MTRYVWDRDLECLVEIGPNSNREGPANRGGASNLIRDIDPYKTAAADKITGKRVAIGGRAQHREFLKRNGYSEVGNDYVPPVREGPRPGEIAREVKRLLGD